jgi:polyhydroxyalkanoate synthesis regulator phasin
MGKISDNQSIKTIEDLIQLQLIEKEALVRLLVKKGVITLNEFKGEVDTLTRKLKEPKR